MVADLVLLLNLQDCPWAGWAEPTTRARIVGIIPSRASEAGAASVISLHHEIIVLLSSGGMSDRDDGACRMHGASTKQSQVPASAARVGL